MRNRAVPTAGSRDEVARPEGYHIGTEVNYWLGRKELPYTSILFAAARYSFKYCAKDIDTACIKVVFIKYWQQSCDNKRVSDLVRERTLSALAISQERSCRKVRILGDLM